MSATDPPDPVPEPDPAPEPDPVLIPGLPAAETPAVTQLLHRWYVMAQKAEDRHSAACDLYERYDQFFGIGSTVLTAIVGSTLFVTLTNSTSEGLRIVVGLIAVIAAVASGIQTTAKYGTLAERYRQASRHYGAVTRQIAELLADPAPAAHMTGELDAIRKALDDTGAMAPNVPPRIWNARGKVGRVSLFDLHRFTGGSARPRANRPD